jgi:hypothetical protein
MRRAVVLSMILVVVALASACRPRERRTTVVLPPEPVPPHAPSEVDRLRTLTLRVQTPRDRFDEADAIKDLRAFLSRNDMTYTIRATRTDSDTPVEAPAMSATPVRVVMEIFRGRESLYTFAFVPRDNRNLAMLGQ